MESEELELINYEIERRRVSEPLRFFRPNGGQERFIEALADKKNRIVVFSAANWIGKTASAIACLGALMWPDQAEAQCFQNDLFKKWDSFGYKRRARIVSTPKELENIGSIQNEIKKWWPVGRYKPANMGKTYASQFSSDTGWIVDLLTYDMAPEQFEGATISFTIFNEPCPEPIYDACLSRMKFGGRVAMPMTPLTNSAWIYDRLVANDGIGGIKVIYGSTEENCIKCGKNGVIPHEAIENLRNSCDPDDREARLEGKFAHLQGQIFKTFSRDTHTFKLENLHDFLPGKETFMVCDPAIGKPLACIWAAVDATGVLWVYDEYPIGVEFQGAKDSNLTVSEYAALFRNKEERRPVGTRILDRHFGNTRRTLGGLTLKQEFGEVGIDFIDSYSIGDSGSEVETGILKVKDMLRYRKDKPIDSLNRPRLMIAEHCLNTIHSLERWRRDEKTGKPKEEYKDFCDCIRYLAMAGPEIEPDRPWVVTPASYGVGN